MNILKTGLAAAAAFAFASSAQATDLEVTHWWTSGGEAAAVAEFAKAFNAGGDNWIDGAIAGSGGVARPIIISRIIGGDPMGATQLNHGRQAEELVEAGLMLDLTDIAEAEGWADVVNPIRLLDSCTLDGKIAIQVAVGGTELYTNILTNKDADAAASEASTKVFEAFAAARELSDGSNVQDWNQATNMVITGMAGGQIHGDWAQGEFQVAEQVAGEDYTCLPGLGVNEIIATGGDAFYFPLNDDPEVTAAQKRMASMMISKEVQVAFNLPTQMGKSTTLWSSFGMTRALLRQTLKRVTSRLLRTRTNPVLI